MTDNRRLIAIVIVLVFIVGGGIVFLTGNRGTAPTEDISDSSVVTSTSVAPVETEAAVVPDTEVVEEEPKLEETAEEVMVPTPKAGLVSTDPAVVNLASGEIQLVEFFAFW